MSSLRSLTADNRRKVLKAVDEYRAEEAEYQGQFKELRWHEHIPSFEHLGGLPRKLLFRLFGHSAKALT